MLYVLLGLLALRGVMDLFLVNQFEYGKEGTPPWSIFASQKFFLAYQIWTILICGVAAFSVWKKHKLLTYISFFILLILLFYPYFTSME